MSRCRPRMSLRPCAASATWPRREVVGRALTIASVGEPLMGRGRVSRTTGADGGPGGGAKAIGEAARELGRDAARVVRVGGATGGSAGIGRPQLVGRGERVEEAVRLARVVEPS